MPTYNFKCPQCGSKESFTMSLKHYNDIEDDVTCLDCTAPMERTYEGTGVLNNCSGFCGRNK